MHTYTPDKTINTDIIAQKWWPVNHNEIDENTSTKIQMQTEKYTNIKKKKPNDVSLFVIAVLE